MWQVSYFHKAGSDWAEVPKPPKTGVFYQGNWLIWLCYACYHGKNRMPGIIHSVGIDSPQGATVYIWSIILAATFMLSLEAMPGIRRCTHI